MRQYSYLLALWWALTLDAAGESGLQTLTTLPDRPPAPAFTLPDADGATHRLSDYHGRVLIVNFWATWCPPCREEMPSMQRAWEQLKDAGIAMLAINVGEDEDTIFAFTASYPVEFPLLLDQDSTVVRRWAVVGLPTTFVVAPDGTLAYRAIGGRAWDDPAIMDRVRRLAGIRGGEKF